MGILKRFLGTRNLFALISLASYMCHHLESVEAISAAWAEPPNTSRRILNSDLLDVSSPRPTLGVGGVTRTSIPKVVPPSVLTLNTRGRDGEMSTFSVEHDGFTPLPAAMAKAAPLPPASTTHAGLKMS